MEVKASTPKPGLLYLNIVRDPVDKEISDDDDDDRNHKHRKREAHSQSLKGDSAHQVLARPYRKRNQTFGNGYPFSEGGFNSNETWKNFSDASQEKSFSGWFDKRRPNVPSFSRGVLDANQNNRIHQPISADPGSAMGRSRDSVMWDQPDSRFSQLDIAAQPVHQGSVPPNSFSRRALITVPNVPSTSWNAFGLIPGIPNGGLDTLHSIGLQGSLRPPFHPSQGMGLPRRQCRDFEERGFCLRGDMCPMEHGVNRIVIDDVQSLSQFNLSAVPVLGTTAAQGHLPANASTSAFMNSKCLQIKNSTHGMTDGGMGIINSTFVGNSVVGVADLYDPDQPLWANNCPEISPARVVVNDPHINENDPLMTRKDTSAQHLVDLSDGTPNDIPRTNVGSTAASQSSSVCGRNRGSKSSKLEVSNTDFTSISSTSLENEVKKETDLVELSQGVVNQDRVMNTDTVGSHFPGLSSKPISDPGCSFKRPYQKASRTLFVSGIPLKDNRREALLTHFKKFGEVIDIYIPSNSERAFIQFFRREEAEAALKAPDAVMGNRFIILRWANRDNLPDDRNGGPSIPSDNTRGVTVALGPASLPISAEGHGNVQTPVLKCSVPNVPITSLITSAVTKPMINSSNLHSTSQKKLENLELLKEELRKKQEMLEQKRNEFSRQLDKLKKHATGLKDAGASSPSKRHKSGALVDVPRIEISKPAADSDFLPSPQPEKMNSSTRSGGSAVSPCNQPISNPALLGSRSLKPSVRPLAPFGPPFVKKYKLDNRPTVFTVLPPLPTGLASVPALKEHFSSYGELSVVELDTFKHKDDSSELDTPKMSACIAYTSRRSAEKAFLNGKSWQGHELQFVWVSIGKVGKESGAKEKTSLSVDADILSAGEVVTTDLQISAAPENIKSKNLNREEQNTSQGDQGEIVKSDKEGNSHLK